MAVVILHYFLYFHLSHVTYMSRIKLDKLHGLSRFRLGFIEFCISLFFPSPLSHFPRRLKIEERKNPTHSIYLVNGQI